MPMLSSHWYALHVATGSELEVAAEISAMPDIRADAPLIARKRRIGPGEWETTYQQMFAGYVFADCILTARRYYRMLRVPGVIRMLGVSPTGQLPEPIPAADMWWIDCLDGVMDVSRGVRDPDGRVRIVSGILLRYEPYITDIDVRQHTATVALSINGQPHQVRFALELIQPEQ